MQGLYTALVTPFTADGNGIDEEGFRENISFQLESGIDGLVVLGSTGEESTVTEEERERIIEIAYEEIGGRVPLVVGTGSASTAETIKKTKMAEELGADAALIVAPYYIRPTQEGIFRHYAAVAKECNLPIILYNNPGRSAVTIDIATLERLGAIPQIIGIKEASGTVEKVKEIRAHIPHWIVMSGDDFLALESLKWGAKGLVSILSNLLPAEMKAYLRGEEIDLSHFIKMTTIESNPIPIKAMMNAAGMAAGPTRLPLCELSEEHKAIVESYSSLPMSCWK